MYSMGAKCEWLLQGCVWAVHAHLFDICMHNCVAVSSCVQACIEYMCAYQHLNGDIHGICSCFQSMR